MGMFGNQIDFSDIWLTALDGGSVGLWDRDIAAGTIRYSRSWNKIIGLDDQGSRFRIEDSYTRIHPNDIEAVKAAMQDHFIQKTEFYESEYRIRCQSGDYKWVLSRGKVIEWDEAGRGVRMVGTTIDITASHEINEKLQIQELKTLADAERLTALAKKLGERSEELAAAHRIARVGSWRWDIPGRCLWFSPEVWKISGHEPQDRLVNYSQIRSMFHPDDYERAMAGFSRAVRDRAHICQEYRIIHSDGSIHNMLTHAEALVGPDGLVNCLHGTTQDISSFRLIEQALAESEDHYRHMVNLHPQITWLADALGNVTEVGPRWLRLTGMTHEETIPHGWSRAVHDEDRPRVLETWQRSLTSGEAMDMEYRVRLKNGCYGWFRARAAARLGSRGEIVRWYGTLEDVTDRRVAEERRRASEALALQVLRTTGDGVIVCDKDGIIKFSNNIAVKLLGSSVNRIGSRITKILDGGHSHQIKCAINAVSSGGASENIEIFWPPADAWYDVHVYPGEDDIAIFIRDITERVISRKRISYAASHDLLTGALNRSVFFERVSECLMEQRSADRVALLCLDLDYFKEINDLHGHPVGDQILKQLVARLKSCTRAKDFIGRCGGDEFAILQTGISTPNDANTLAERILVAMRDEFEIDGILLSNSVTIGVSVANIGFSDAELFYKQADLALYEAKTKARGTCQIFRPEMQIQSDWTKRMRIDLKAAIGTNQLTLAFQPIMRTSDLSIVGVEALLRWRHPERGLISPAEFIPVAEDSGLIISIGDWVLRRACQAARDWPENIKLSVNVSVRQFENTNLELNIRNALTDADLPASRLKIEVTESVIMKERSSCLSIMANIQKLGVSVVLDDFGTGYSSLSYINTFPFDFIKIDKSFISEVCLPSDRQPIFEAIMGMSHAIRIPVTVEGVETQCQLDYVRGLGCEFVQGYLLGRPMDAAELLNVFATAKL